VASLEEILALPEREERHHLLERFVAENPSNARAHLHLGISYWVNCTNPMLDEVPPSVLVIGPARVPREIAIERADRAEQHLKRAMKLDRHLKKEAKAQLKAIKFLRNPHG
jgi:hypothetical protein